MLILTGGRERTTDEYGYLFAAAGLRLTRATPTSSRLVIMEAASTADRLSRMAASHTESHRRELAGVTRGIDVIP